MHFCKSISLVITIGVSSAGFASAPVKVYSSAQGAFIADGQNSYDMRQMKKSYEGMLKTAEAYAAGLISAQADSCAEEVTQELKIEEQRVRKAIQDQTVSSAFRNLSFQMAHVVGDVVNYTFSISLAEGSCACEVDLSYSYDAIKHNLLSTNAKAHCGLDRER